MPSAETVVMLLAGGAGSRLNILGQARAKPAIPFGGMYRIIDFTLSNAMNSRLTNIGILTQYKPYSLMTHIGTGASWDFVGQGRSAHILPPHTGTAEDDWYRGTADAVWQNWSHIEGFNSRYVLVLSGDHIYSMDYSKMIDFHIERGADTTIAAMVIDPTECRHFGMIHADDDNKILRFEEKPKTTTSRLASMGVYVFSTKALEEDLRATKARKGVDFGKDVLPSMLGRRRMFAYPFQGYWRDVGTIKAYWEAHMDLLDPDSGLDLEAWNVYTNPDDRSYQDRPPSRLFKGAKVDGSLVARGCSINGVVEKSILSPGVIVESGAIVRRSVILHDTIVRCGAKIDYAVIDKDVVIGEGAKVGHGRENPPNEQYPTHLDCGITLIGKGALVPAGITIGRSCIVKPRVREEDFAGDTVASGQTVDATPRME